MTGGELAARALAAHGVTDVFGIPGTHNLPLYGALAANGIRHILPRHEQGAGYAAIGYAVSAARPGVAITTTGPAAMNIAAAAGQANSDSIPLLVLAPGMPLGHPTASSGYLHEQPDQRLAMSGVVERAVRCETHAELARELAAAFCAFSSARPRARYIEIPLDLLAAVGEAAVLGPVRVARPAPDPEAIAAAATVLAGAARPGIVAGGGSRGAAAGVRELAERLGAPVITTVNGKGVLDESHPLALGARLNTGAARAWLEDRDALLAVGTELGESDLWTSLSELPGAVVRVDIDPLQAHSNVPATVPVIGDARLALEALADALRDGGSVAGRASESRAGSVPGPADAVAGAGSVSGAADGAADGVAGAGSVSGGADAVAGAGSVFGPTDTAAAVRTAPSSTAAAATGAGSATETSGSVAGAAAAATVRAALDAEWRAGAAPWLDWIPAIQDALPDDALVVADNAMCAYRAAIPGLRVRRLLFPTGFGTLGYAIPAALGAALGAPERPVLALSGDGGLMFSVAELAAAATLRLPLPVLVFVNDGFGEIRAGMVAAGFEPLGVDFAPPDLVALARSLGCAATAVAAPDELREALASAFAHPAPTLIVVPER